MADAIRQVGVSANTGAYLGPGTKITGKLHFDAPATIEGEVEGEIIAQASVTIAQDAVIKGKINASTVIVQGKVTADILAEKRLEIQAPGTVFGDVNTQSLVIGDGAVLEGQISMRKEARVLPIRQEAKKESAS